MSGEFLGVFESSAIFLMDGDPGSAERVVADRGRKPDGLAAAFDRRQHVASVHWLAGESSAPGASALEQRCFATLLEQPCGGEVRADGIAGAVVARDPTLAATFLVQD